MEKVITEVGKTQLKISNDISKEREFNGKITLEIDTKVYCNSGVKNKIVLSKRQINKLINVLLEFL
jgi:hypothetical protein